MGDTGDEGDIMPTSGKVTFASGQASKRLELTVMADKVSNTWTFLFSSSYYVIFFYTCIIISA